MNARHGSGRIGNRPLVTRVDHARPLMPANRWALEAALVYVAYRLGVVLTPAVEASEEAFGRRVLGGYVLSEREARLARIAAVYPAAAAEARMAGERGDR